MKLSYYCASFVVILIILVTKHRRNYILIYNANAGYAELLIWEEIETLPITFDLFLSRVFLNFANNFTDV